MAEFYQSVLVKVEEKDVLSKVYPPHIAKQLTLNERLVDCKCTECQGTKWMILPKESSMVQQGGKPYIECLECGNITHL